MWRSPACGPDLSRLSVPDLRGAGPHPCTRVPRPPQPRRGSERGRPLGREGGGGVLETAFRPIRML